MIPDAIYDAAPSVKTVWCAAAAAEASAFSQCELREASGPMMGLTLRDGTTEGPCSAAPRY